MTTLIDRTIIPKNRTIVVAVSGGIDSMVLLHQLIRFRTSSKWRLVVCHVDHGKRPESTEEYRFVEAYCETHGVLFVGMRLGSLPRGNFQEAARRHRYSFFVSVAKRENAEAIVLAHHLDDQAETVLMRLFRGSSLDGHAGMQEVSDCDGILLLRPLLKRTKEEIRAYQQIHQVPYREDSSNLQNDYTRNKIRHDLIPAVERIFPRWKQAIEPHAVLIREASVFVDKAAQSFFEASVSTDEASIGFPRETFCSLDAAVKRAVLIKAWRRLRNNESDLSFRHQTAILHAIDSNKPNASVRLEAGHLFVRSYSDLAFRRPLEPSPTYQRILPASGHLALPSGETVFIGDCGNIPDGIEAFLCYNDTNRFLPLTARTRRIGDTLSFPYGTKKLGDWLIDKKVPKARRDALLLIVSNDGEIQWIPALGWLKRNEGTNTVHLTVRKG